MRKPPYRTVILVGLLALMGGVALCVVKGNFADYASLLKALGWAVAVKSGWEHGANVFTKPEPVPPEKP
jgi:hypothetical protein